MGKLLMRGTTLGKPSARHSTAAELNQLAAFYRAPIGAEALREIPQVMGEFSASLVPRLQNLQVQITVAFGQILSEHGYG